MISDGEQGEAQTPPHLSQLAQPHWAPAPGGPLVRNLGKPGFALSLSVLHREVVLVGVLARAGPGMAADAPSCRVRRPMEGPHSRRTRALSACVRSVHKSAVKGDAREQGGAGVPGHQVPALGAACPCLLSGAWLSAAPLAPCRALTDSPGGTRPEGQWPDSWTRRAADWSWEPGAREAQAWVRVCTRTHPHTPHALTRHTTTRHTHSHTCHTRTHTRRTCTHTHSRHARTTRHTHALTLHALTPRTRTSRTHAGQRPQRVFSEGS